MKIRYFKNKNEAALAAGKFLGNFFVENIDIPILFMSSGGSAFSILEHAGPATLHNRSVVTVLDERFSEDSAISNFYVLRRTKFFRHLKCKSRTKKKIRHVNFIDTEARVSESLLALTNRFELSLRNWKRANPEGKIIITQGIGMDGHTGGIMPYPEDKKEFKRLFLNPKRWVVGYDATKAKNKYPRRVTVTMPFLQDIVDHSIFFVTNLNKKFVLKHVMDDSGELHVTPGRIVKEMKNVTVFTSVR